MKPYEIIFTRGWGPEETAGRVAFRWMMKNAGCTIEGILAKGRRWLSISGGHPFPQAQNPRLTVRTPRDVLGEMEIFPFANTFLFPIEDRSPNLEILFEADRTFPQAITGDPRDLGLMITEIKVYTSEATFLPSGLELESSTRCNINPPCLMCYPRLFDTRGYIGEIDRPVFDKLAPYLKNFQRISLHGVGEPLLGQKLWMILDNIDTDKTWVQFNSNGLLLTEEICHRLIRQKLELINFSLDAATPETYRKLRRSDFDTVVGNILRLSEIKKERRVKIPVIQVNMTLMKENLPDLLPFVDLAERLGAEFIHLGLLNPFREYEVENKGFTFNYREQTLDPRSEDFIAIIKKARRKAAQFGIRLDTEFSTYRP